MSGWFAVKRGTLEHTLFAPKGPFSKYEAWVWMIENAPYKDGTVVVRGKTYPTKRGHLYHSIRFMAGKFRWSEKAVRVFVAALEKEGAVEKIGAQPRAQFGAQLKLCNYDKYQGKGHSQGHSKGHKEEQGITIPVGTDQNPSAEVLGFEGVKATAWKVGKAYLSRHGVKNPGPLIGRWLKDTDATGLLRAIEAAEREQTQDPVPYITKFIANGGKPTSFGKKQMTNAEWLSEAVF